MSHYKSNRLSVTTRRATGGSKPAPRDQRRVVLSRAILIVAIGVFVFMAATAIDLF